MTGPVRGDLGHLLGQLRQGETVKTAVARLSERPKAYPPVEEAAGPRLLRGTTPF